MDGRRRRRLTTTSPSSRRCASAVSELGQHRRGYDLLPRRPGARRRATRRRRRTVRDGRLDEILLDARRVAVADRARRLDHARLRDAARRPLRDRRAVRAASPCWPSGPGMRRSRRRSRSDRRLRFRARAPERPRRLVGDGAAHRHRGDAVRVDLRHLHLSLDQVAAAGRRPASRRRNRSTRSC